MTNGELIQKVFNCEVCEPIPEDDIIHIIFTDKKDSAIGFDWSWWNAEYKEPTIQERQAESDKFDAAFQDEYNNGYAQARFDYEQESTTKNDNEQEDITWIIGNDNVQIAVRNMPIDMMQKICSIIGNTKNDLGVDCIDRAVEIKVGDEVTVQGDNGIVVREPYPIGSDKELFVLVWYGQYMSSNSLKNVAPTGRHFPQIAEVLEQLKRSC